MASTLPATALVLGSCMILMTAIPGISTHPSYSRYPYPLPRDPIQHPENLPDFAMVGTPISQGIGPGQEQLPSSENIGPGQEQFPPSQDIGQGQEQFPSSRNNVVQIQDQFSSSQNIPYCSKAWNPWYKRPPHQCLPRIPPGFIPPLFYPRGGTAQEQLQFPESSPPKHANHNFGWFPPKIFPKYPRGLSPRIPPGLIPPFHH